MSPFFKRPPRPSASRWALSAPLLHFSDRDSWTVGDACQGTQIFGSTGCGKSTGPLAEICLAFLNAGFGGIFLTAKPDDRRVYEGYCRRTGREADVMVFGPNEPLRYNPFDAELHRSDAGAGFNESIVSLLSTTVEISDRNQGQGDSEDSSYWKRSNLQLMRNSVDLLVMAKGRVSAPELYELVVSAAASEAQLNSEDWRRSSLCFQCLMEADCKAKTPQQRRDYKLVLDFFWREWPKLSEKTRSVVLSTFTSMLDVLNRGIVRELMGGDTNVKPEMTQDGAVIIIDVPLLVFGQLGVFIQVLWKYCFQKVQERRDTAANDRPVFLVVDESHLVTVAQDQVFQTTARSTRTAVAYATQNISNYLVVLGERSEPQVHSLLGNLQTQIFCQQTDVRTNNYSAELIGRTRQYRINANSSHQPGDWIMSALGQRAGQASAGINETVDFEIQPSRFPQLTKGGSPEWIVESIVYQGGRQFSDTRRPWMPVAFRQHLPTAR